MARVNDLNEGKIYLEICIRDNGLGFDNKTRMKGRIDESKVIAGSLDGTDSSFADLDKLVKRLNGQIYYTDEVAIGSKSLLLIPYDSIENNELGIENIEINKDNVVAFGNVGFILIAEEPIIKLY